MQFTGYDLRRTIDEWRGGPVGPVIATLKDRSHRLRCVQRRAYGTFFIWVRTTMAEAMAYHRVATLWLVMQLLQVRRAIRFMLNSTFFPPVFFFQKKTLCTPCLPFVTSVLYPR